MHKRENPQAEEKHHQRPFFKVAEEPERPAEKLNNSFHAVMILVILCGEVVE
jgi:hypothetical protein